MRRHPQESWGRLPKWGPQAFFIASVLSRRVDVDKGLSSGALNLTISDAVVT